MAGSSVADHAVIRRNTDSVIPQIGDSVHTA
jgi:hypothetical protein